MTFLRVFECVFFLFTVLRNSIGSLCYKHFFFVGHLNTKGCVMLFNCHVLYFCLSIFLFFLYDYGNDGGMFVYIIFFGADTRVGDLVRRYFFFSIKHKQRT